MKTTKTNTFPVWPYYAEDEIEAVHDVLRSGHVNYWTGGQGRDFGREYADYVGVGFGIALANGTVALELALRALNIGPGDEVIVTSRSFVASASSITICGATPVFADVDLDSQNVTAETIAPHITIHTRAIVVVHLAGWPCEMPPIMELAKKNGIQVIEDCAQAHGARLNDQPVGSFGDIATFSFCQDKIISTGGEGGMLLTNSEALWEKAWAYKDHGKNYKAVSEVHQDGESGPFRWVHESFGSNFRMTEMQAAIGRLQLRKLDLWVDRRRCNASILIDQLSTAPGLRIPVPKPHVHHSYYKFYAFLKLETLSKDWTRNRVIEEINGRGVPCFGGSCSEIYKEKAFQTAGYGPETALVNALNLGESSLMFVVHPTLSEADMRHMTKVIKNVAGSMLA